MLGAAQADALCAVAARLGGLFGLVGVGPHAHAADAVGPAEDLLELGLVLEPGADRRDGTEVDLAGGAVEADLVAFLEADIGQVRTGGLVRVVDDELRAAGDARLADLAGDDGGVGGRAAAGGQDALGDGHAVEVVGRRLDPDEDDLLAALDPFDRRVRAEHGPPDGRPRRSVEALGDARRLGQRAWVELVAQQLVDVGGLDPGDRFFLGDRALVDHVGRDPHGGGRGPLGAAGLEHVQAAALDRELEVLDVAVVRLELLADALEFGVDLGHLGLHLGDLGGGPDAGHDVLALGVGQVLAEQHLLAGVRVARERHARAGVVAHVAEDHRHDVDGRAQVVRDVLVLAVVRGALAEPRREDGLDREVELLVGVLGEVATRVGLDDRLELRDEGLERRRRRGRCPAPRRARSWPPRAHGRSARR